LRQQSDGAQGDLPDRAASSGTGADAPPISGSTLLRRRDPKRPPDNCCRSSTCLAREVPIEQVGCDRQAVTAVGRANAPRLHHDGADATAAHQSLDPMREIVNGIFCVMRLGAVELGGRRCPP
jgi:hypothetical protein